MEVQRKPLRMLSLVLISIFSFESYWVAGGAVSQVPCYFIFGDSLVDNGNNNNNEGVARADYSPYGIDFPTDMVPTGRFTNGRNIADFIAEYLGFENYIPPFKNSTGCDIFKGLNYASGAAGIRDESGTTQGERTSFNQQLLQHKDAISKSESGTHLDSCLYLVNIGANDYLNNYFMPLSYNTSLQFTPQDYATALNNQLSDQLKTLYGYGARKIAVYGVGLVGCTPYVKAAFDHEGSPCVNHINNAIQLFNIGLKSLVDDLNANLCGAKFIFIDTINIAIQATPIILGPPLNQDTPCCELRADGIQCLPSGNVCGNRNEYIFWDGVHPTEIGMMTLASRGFQAQHPDDAYPFDISHLLQPE